MFAINNELLSKSSHPEEWAWKEKKLKEIRSSNKKTVVFKAYQKAAFHEEVDTGRAINMPRNRIIGQEATFYNEDLDLTQTWAYSPHVNGFIHEHGAYTLRKKGLKIAAEEVLDTQRDAELIFFLRYCSQNRYIKEVDIDKDNREKAEKIMAETEAKNLIYSKKSVIHPDVIGSEGPMRAIATAWGVSVTDEMSYYTIIDELWNRVQISNTRFNNTKRGFKEFVEEVLKLGDGTKRTTVILGIQKEVLFFKDNVWYLNEKGGSERILVAVPIGDENNKNEILVKYLVENERAYESVELSIQDGSNITAIGKLQEKRTRQDLLKECRESLNWPNKILNNKKNPELEDIVNNKEQYVPTE